MGYIVSARKYRPQTFEDVVGQEQITTTLKRSIENDHLAQAFLFCGPRGVGKTTCARIMAKAVNTGKTENLDQIEEDFSFNIFELDAASNNKVDDVHQLIAQVRIPPQTGKFKIYIIDEVHMLSQAAFNAFLKTLEEPPPYAIFILATTEKHKILPTILSRCQIYDFKRIAVSDIVSHLKNIAKQENITVEDNALHIIAEKADGALRDALSIFDRLVSFSGDKLTYDDAVKSLNVLDYDYFFKISTHLASADLTSALLELDTILSNGFEGDHFINGLSKHLRNLLICKDERSIKLLEVSDDLKQRYYAQAKLIPFQFLVNSLSLASECDVNYAMSIQKRLLVETTLMKMAYLNQKVSIQEPKQEMAQKKKSSLSEKSQIEKQEQASSSSIGAYNNENEPTPRETKEQLSTSKTSNLSLADLEAEVEKEIVLKKSEENQEDKEIIEEKASGDLPLNQENMFTIWKNFLDKIKNDNSSKLYHSLDDKTPFLKDNSIEIIADSEIEKRLIENELIQIKAWFNSYLNTKDYTIKIKLTKNTKPKKIILNSKDIYLKMAEKNPLLNQLKDNLDLELDL